MGVCTEEDDFVRDALRYVAVLSNGVTVYEDDERPSEDQPGAWRRLREYCLANQVGIRSISLQFRSHIIDITHANAQAYYLAKGVMAVAGESTLNCYIMGPWMDGVATVTHWKTPELIPFRESTRDIPADSENLIPAEIGG